MSNSKENNNNNNPVIHEIHQDLDRLLNVIEDLKIRTKGKPFTTVNDNRQPNPHLLPFDPIPPPPPPRSHSQLTSQLLKPSNKVVKESSCSSSASTCDEERVEGESVHEVNHEQFTNSTRESTPCSEDEDEDDEEEKDDDARQGDEIEKRHEPIELVLENSHKESSFSSKYLVNTLHAFDPGDLSPCKDTLENNNNKLLALPPCVCKLCTSKHSDDTCGINGIEAPMNNPKSIIVKSSSSIPAEVEKSTFVTTTVILSQVLLEVTSTVEYVPVTKSNSSDYFIGKIFLTWSEREQQQQQPLWSSQLSSSNDRPSYSSSSCGCCDGVKVGINSTSTPSLNQRQQIIQNSTCKSPRLSVSSPSLPASSLLKKARIIGAKFKNNQFGRQLEAPELSSLEKLLTLKLNEIKDILEKKLNYQHYDCRSYYKTCDDIRIMNDRESLVAPPVTIEAYKKVQLYCKSVTSDSDPVADLVVREMDLVLPLQQ